VAKHRVGLGRWSQAQDGSCSVLLATKAEEDQVLLATAVDALLEEEMRG